MKQEKLLAWLLVTLALSAYIIVRYNPAVPVPSPLLAGFVVFVLIGLFVGCVFTLVSLIGRLRR